MSALRGILFCAAVLLVFNLVESTEFVPCFIWSNKRTGDKVPALNKISQDVFKEGMERHLKDDSIDLIVVYAEETLSPEDFAQRDDAGVAFPNLAKISKTTKASYLPNVQRPIEALDHLDATVTQVSVDKLDKGLDISETDVLIVNLIDAEDDENRIDMLRRHDSKIASSYEEFSRSGKNILCIYTSRHSSWLASEAVESRQKRSLLQVEENAESENGTKVEGKPRADVPARAGESPFWSGPQYLIYMTELAYVTKTESKTATGVTVSVTPEGESEKYTVTISATKPAMSLKMVFQNLTQEGYWTMTNKINGTFESKDVTFTSGSPVEVRSKFSYHCGDHVFTSDSAKVTLKNFQIQLYFAGKAPTNNKFNDAYDCVGFTSVPIWSGIFVTTILLIIMSIGITMMMDIRTMDKFDDAKGKTITINAE
ncbi:unnamed protein product [Phyllotreta striolata]|uniref:Vacuolar ATP synthase subunit S1 n=1 Tax=Phyllotreta striolata TaxID=444603 RepID=A0A9N9XIH8_PHYSR|nr:unnamed protein product [Phyllotreta striolata]